MINDLIDLFLIRNYPDSFSANEINSQLNAELSEYSEIQFFQKAIYAYLSSDDCNCIHANKDNTPRFRIREESFMGVETVDTLRKRAKKGVLRQEIIIKTVLSLLLEERDGFKLKDILYEIKNDVTATVQDVHLVLWGTLRSNISLDKVSFNYKITNVDLALELKEDLKYLEEEHEILGAEDETRAKELIQTFGFTEESEDYFLSKRRWLTFEGFHRESADVSIEENSKYEEDDSEEPQLGVSDQINTDHLSLNSLVSDYQKCSQRRQDIGRKPMKERTSIYREELININKTLPELIEKMVELVVCDKISINELKQGCDQQLYRIVTSHSRLVKHVNQKQKTHQIEKDTYEEKLIEFKILVQAAWEDGVVDEYEQIQIDQTIIELGIDYTDANRIFHQIKGEYEESILDDKIGNNQENLFDKTITIDNVSFHFKILEQPMSPLFWHKFENNMEVVYVNNSHQQYNDFDQNLLMNLIATLCKTKLSFSDEAGNVFVNRFSSYMNLVDLKK